MRYDQFDSLDANVLNDSYEEKQEEQERMEAFPEEEVSVWGVAVHLTPGG